MRNKVLPGLAKHVKPIAIEKANLGPGIVAEAVSKNKIVVNSAVDENCELHKLAVIHETHHVKEMAKGRIAYGENWVRDGDQVFKRKNGKIQNNGNWHVEGSDLFPWERRAMKAENDV